MNWFWKLWYGIGRVRCRMFGHKEPGIVRRFADDSIIVICPRCRTIVTGGVPCTRNGERIHV